jgi:hypothetical protein
MKFPEGLKLYMKRDDKRLDGITLHRESDPDYREAFWKRMGWERGVWPVFDINAPKARLSRTNIVYTRLENYFNLHLLGKEDRHENPCILACLFVAEGTSTDVSLAMLLDLGDKACALAGSPVPSNSSASASEPAPSNSSASTPEPAPSTSSAPRGIEDAIKRVQSLCDAALKDQEKIEQLQFLVNTWKAHETK